jgi:hypothetical protein
MRSAVQAAAIPAMAWPIGLGIDLQSWQIPQSSLDEAKVIKFVTD